MQSQTNPGPSRCASMSEIPFGRLGRTASHAAAYSFWGFSTLFPVRRNGHTSQLPPSSSRAVKNPHCPLELGLFLDNLASHLMSRGS